jgi:hypothetical protein
VLELRLLPLFTTDALPQYKSFFAETAAEKKGAVTEADLKWDDRWNIVTAAYATNNTHLLQWCLDLCDADFQPIIPVEWFRDALERCHHLAYEETTAWMALNVPLAFEAHSL